NIPRGVCRHFWTKGRCFRGDECRFDHTANPDVPVVPEASSSSKLYSEARGLGSFPSLEIDKFAAEVGSNKTPGQTHHFLKRFTEDSFRFETSSQVYAFLELVCSANTENTSWTADEGYVHMHTLVRGNGFLRFSDAIRYPEECTGPWSFQRGYVPLLTYLSSKWVSRSNIDNDVNALYSLVHTNFEVFNNTIQTHMKRLMNARSFKEPGRKPLSGVHVFKVLFNVLYEYLTRFKNVAIVENPDVCLLSQRAASWFDDWALALNPPSSFDDECASYDGEVKAFIVKSLDQDKARVLSVIEHGPAKISNSTASQIVRSGSVGSGTPLKGSQRIFDNDSTGDLLDKVPHRGNNNIAVKDAHNAPKHEGLVGEDDRRLPRNSPETPHFNSQRSVESLLDVQFQLFREELTASIRQAIQLVVTDLRKYPTSETLLWRIIEAGGGRYAAPANVQESMIFSVFTNVTFEPLATYSRGASVGVVFDAPPGKARSEQAATRAGYWEQVAKRRLIQGGLVALVWKDSSDRLDIYLGTVASSPRDILESTRSNEDRVSLRVSFFDTSVESRIVHALQNHGATPDIRVLVEAPARFESIHPFREALKLNPEFLPFSRHICRQSSEEVSNRTSELRCRSIMVWTR
ncbi:hypothetical protein FRC09_000287, partial [Ceratobasidium sp. 395]